MGDEANEAALPQVTASSSAVAGRTSSAVAGRITSWRLPSEPGKLPSYIRKQFRVKALSLLVVQASIMYGIMIPVHLAFEHSHMSKDSLQVVFILLGVMTVTPMIMLHLAERKYPLNYGLLVAITLFGGTWWGSMSHSAVGVHLQNWGMAEINLQFFGCVCGSLCAATAIAILQPCAGTGRLCTVVAPLLGGWASGATAEVLISLYLGLQMHSALVAAFLVLLLLAMVMLEVGGLLAECEPDCFMRVVLAMNSNLLVIISVPVFLFGACIVASMPTPEGQDAAEVAAEPSAR